MMMLLNTIEEPDYIIKGYKNALIGLREIKKGKFLAVVYKEISKEDGFIITAYFTRKINMQREVVVLWRKK